MSAIRVHPGWRVAGPALLVCFGLLGWLYARTHVSFFELWNNSDSYGHGLFVVPIALYAVWLLREPLLGAPPRAWLPGVLGVLGCALAWAAAYLTGIEVGEQLAVAGLVAAVVLSLTGPRITWLLGFPLAYFLLAVPVWDLFVPLLQDHTASVSAWTLKQFGVPVFLQGIYLSIPSGNFEIAEVCAGLRYLMAMTSIGAFYAFLNGLSLVGGLGFVALSIAWAILFNWIRVTGIIAVGHLSQMQHALVHDHYTYGWILFAVALLPLFYFGRWFPSAAPLPAVTAPSDDTRSVAGPALIATAVAVALAVGPLLSAYLLERQPNGVGSFAWPASGAEGWRRVEAAGSDDWRPSFPGAAWSGVTRFQGPDGDQAQMFVALYGRQSQGAELINTTNRLFDTSGWSEAPKVDAIPVSRSGRTGGSPAAAERVELTLRNNRGSTRVIWYYYRVAGAAHTSDLGVKLAQMRGLIQGKPAGAVVALAVDGGRGGVDAARATLDRAFRAVNGPVAAAIDGAVGR